MNDGGYRVPGREVDETAIEQEKIRQAGETKRKLIEEKEKTKRDIANERRVRWTDQAFLTTLGACTFFLCAFGAIGASCYFDTKKRPDPPPRCVETSEIVTANTTKRYCEHGGRLETERLGNGDVLVKCLCYQTVQVSDAGHP